MLDFTITVIFLVNILCRFFLLIKYAVVGLKQTRENLLSLVAAVYSAHFLKAWLFYGCPSFALSLVKALQVHMDWSESRDKPSALNCV